MIQSEVLEQESANKEIRSAANTLSGAHSLRQYTALTSTITSNNKIASKESEQEEFISNSTTKHHQGKQEENEAMPLPELSNIEPAHSLLESDTAMMSTTSSNMSTLAHLQKNNKMHHNYNNVHSVVLPHQHTDRSSSNRSKEETNYGVECKFSKESGNDKTANKESINATHNLQKKMSSQHVIAHCTPLDDLLEHNVYAEEEFGEAVARKYVPLMSVDLSQSGAEALPSSFLPQINEIRRIRRASQEAFLAHPHHHYNIPPLSSSPHCHPPPPSSTLCTSLLDECGNHIDDRNNNNNADGNNDHHINDKTDNKYINTNNHNNNDDNNDTSLLNVAINTDKAAERDKGNTVLLNAFTNDNNINIKGSVRSSANSNNSNNTIDINNHKAINCLDSINSSNLTKQSSLPSSRSSNPRRIRTFDVVASQTELPIEPTLTRELMSKVKIAESKAHKMTTNNSNNNNNNSNNNNNNNINIIHWNGSSNNTSSSNSSHDNISSSLSSLLTEASSGPTLVFPDSVRREYDKLSRYTTLRKSIDEVEDRMELESVVDVKLIASPALQTYNTYCIIPRSERETTSRTRTTTTTATTSLLTQTNSADGNNDFEKKLTYKDKDDKQQIANEGNDINIHTANTSITENDAVHMMKVSNINQVKTTSQTTHNRESSLEGDCEEQITREENINNNNNIIIDHSFVSFTTPFYFQHNPLLESSSEQEQLGVNTINNSPTATIEGNDKYNTYDKESEETEQNLPSCTFDIEHIYTRHTLLEKQNAVQVREMENGNNDVNKRSNLSYNYCNNNNNNNIIKKSNVSKSNTNDLIAKPTTTTATVKEEAITQTRVQSSEPLSLVRETEILHDKAILQEEHELGNVFSDQSDNNRSATVLTECKKCHCKQINYPIDKENDSDNNNKEFLLADNDVKYKESVTSKSMKNVTLMQYCQEEQEEEEEEEVEVREDNVTYRRDDEVEQNILEDSNRKEQDEEEEEKVIVVHADHDSEINNNNELSVNDSSVIAHDNNNDCNSNNERNDEEGTNNGVDETHSEVLQMEEHSSIISVFSTSHNDECDNKGEDEGEDNATLMEESGSIQHHKHCRNVLPQSTSLAPVRITENDKHVTIADDIDAATAAVLLVSSSTNSSNMTDSLEPSYIYVVSSSGSKLSTREQEEEEQYSSSSTANMNSSLLLNHSGSTRAPQTEADEEDSICNNNNNSKSKNSSSSNTEKSINTSHMHERILELIDMSIKSIHLSHNSDQENNKKNDCSNNINSKSESAANTHKQLLEEESRVTFNSELQLLPSPCSTKHLGKFASIEPRNHERRQLTQHIPIKLLKGNKSNGSEQSANSSIFDMGRFETALQHLLVDEQEIVNTNGKYSSKECEESLSNGNKETVPYKFTADNDADDNVVINTTRGNTSNTILPSSASRVATAAAVITVTNNMANTTDMCSRLNNNNKRNNTENVESNANNLNSYWSAADNYRNNKENSKTTQEKCDNEADKNGIACTNTAGINNFSFVIEENNYNYINSSRSSSNKHDDTLQIEKSAVNKENTEEEEEHKNNVNDKVPRPARRFRVHNKIYTNNNDKNNRNSSKNVSNDIRESAHSRNKQAKRKQNKKSGTMSIINNGNKSATNAQLSHSSQLSSSSASSSVASTVSSASTSPSTPRPPLSANNKNQFERSLMTSHSTPHLACSTMSNGNKNNNNHAEMSTQESDNTTHTPLVLDNNNVQYIPSQNISTSVNG